MSRVQVAVVQAGSWLMDTERTVGKAIKLAAQAAGEGALVVVFPEAFLGGYPWGLRLGTTVGGRSAAGRRDFARYWQQALVVPGPQVERLSAAARRLGIYLVMGVVERAARGGTLYCTLLYFAPDGRLLGTHRKLKPTAAERLIWGEGDGSTLTVIDTPYGRLGGLICWEHYMPLARAAMLAQGIDIWVAPTMDQREVWQSTIRHMAKEGRCFVLSAVQYLTQDMYPGDLACQDELAGQPAVLCSGGSAIVSPLGDYLAGPLCGEEGILHAHLCLEELAASRFDFDPIGHYSRPDVFELRVDTRPKTGFSSPGSPGGSGDGST